MNTKTTQPTLNNKFSKGIEYRLKDTDFNTKCNFCKRPLNPHNTKKFTTCCSACSIGKGNGNHTKDCNNFHDYMKDGPICL